MLLLFLLGQSYSPFFTGSGSDSGGTGSQGQEQAGQVLKERFTDRTGSQDPLLLKKKFLILIIMKIKIMVIIS